MPKAKVIALPVKLSTSLRNLNAYKEIVKNNMLPNISLKNTVISTLLTFMAGTSTFHAVGSLGLKHPYHPEVHDINTLLAWPWPKAGPEIRLQRSL
jgi:hypothetical protein